MVCISGENRMKKAIVIFLLLPLIIYGAMCLLALQSPGPGDMSWQSEVKVKDWAKRVDLPSGHLYYLEAGRGIPVLLIHGFADSSYSWHKNIQTLSENGFHVFAVDLPGMGQSMPAAGFNYTPEDLAVSLIEFLDYLGLERVNVVGNSLGGSLALVLALRHPERVLKLVAVDPACYPNSRHTLYSMVARNPWLAVLVKPLIGPWIFRIGLRRSYHDPSKVTKSLYSEKAQVFRRSDWVDNLIKLGGNYFSKAFDDFSRQYGSISAPTLLIWGATDRLINTDKFAQRLHRNMPGSNLVVLEKAGHLPHQEQPQVFNQLIIDFLR